MKNSLFLLLFCTGCCFFNEMKSKCDMQESLCKKYRLHMIKVQNHFKGIRAYDISSLIFESHVLSQKFKRMGDLEKTRKLNSIIDVLSFGNKTIDESLDDVITITRQEIQPPCNGDI